MLDGSWLMTHDSRFMAHGQVGPARPQGAGERPIGPLYFDLGAYVPSLLSGINGYLRKDINHKSSMDFVVCLFLPWMNLQDTGKAPHSSAQRLPEHLLPPRRPERPQLPHSVFWLPQTSQSAHRQPANKPASQPIKQATVYAKEKL